MAAVGRGGVMPRRGGDAGAQTAPDAGALTALSAEDVRVQQYGDAALVAFRLVGATTKDGKTEVASYLNTGPFVRRQDQWRAVGWQATRVPAVGDER